MSLQTVTNREGNFVAMNRNGAVVVVDDKGHERERYSVVYGARIKYADGAPVKMGEYPGGVGSLHVLDPDRSRRARSIQGSGGGNHPAGTGG